MIEFKHEMVMIEKQKASMFSKENDSCKEKLCQYSIFKEQCQQTICILRKELKCSHMAIADQASFDPKKLQIDANKLEIGAEVAARNYQKKNFWQKGKIIKMSNNFYCTVEVNGQEWRKNVDHLRPVSYAHIQSAQETNKSEIKPFRTFVLSNMFNLSSENHPDWDQEVRKAVFNECQNLGGVTHVYVDKKSDGYVFVKCPILTTVVACVTALNGSLFRERIIGANYIEERMFQPFC
ncbi:hypothetical protein JTE90_005240 [Oedothorax gibbosus]|uniref:RRM domain-containing protein n=1 Tax=Oedothorax gibbosus TaxID=931172 RepID=A0AAV6TPH1_9ARAC|nr:hypothetical protein JTE90_005240 [Oedothorax gibbosus]